MSALVLRQRQANSLRIDLSALTPERLAGLAAPQIERLELMVGRRVLALAEVFEVRGGDVDTLVIQTAGDRCDRIGAGLTRGELRVEGDAGAYLGAGARGGRIVVAGSCGAYCASGASGAAFEIGGHAGEFLGAAAPGEHAGMSGGSVHVRGNVGDRAADHMRRGLILVEGDVADYAGSRMGGGTLVVLGACGSRPGYAMRRGTVLCLGPAPVPGPTFNDAGTHRLGFLALVARAWRTAAPESSRFTGLLRDDTRARRWVGDAGFGGQGELLHWAA
jgi:formylmethanofuran dehydrogenase subunit C